MVTTARPNLSRCAPARRALALCTPMLAAACTSSAYEPDLGKIYDRAAQGLGNDRTPVVVLPGTLGSRLENSTNGKLVWGAFTPSAVDANDPEGAREIALPMRWGVPLAELRDDVVATAVLETVQVRIGILPSIGLAAYVDIMRSLGVGRYRDSALLSDQNVDYGGLHTTCFQLAYDWRRGVSENALHLHDSIRSAQDGVRALRQLPPDAPVRVDVVAHSMGALVLRYYLRYGPHALPADGSAPELTWEGAANVSRAVLVSPPNAGSAMSLDRLVGGWGFGPLLRRYPAAVIGSMPSVYQLLPRTRHKRLIDKATGQTIDIFDPQVWERRSMGLLDPEQDELLSWLLPSAKSRTERKRIALDHVTKCLARAQQLHRALDLQSSPPPGLELHLFAGDAAPTPSVLSLNDEGRVGVVQEAPGDEVVTRASALLDERVGGPWRTEVRSPIEWAGVHFIHEEHIGITRDIGFTDNLLYLLLEAPRGHSPGTQSGRANDAAPPN